MSRHRTCISRLPLTRLPLTLLHVAAALLLVAPASAQVARFDFHEPGAHQEGAYSPDANAELLSGTARLLAEETPPWHGQGWRYRLSVRITNASGGALAQHPLRIDLASAPRVLFDEARLDGADLLPVLVSSGGVITTRWVESLDFISRTGALWVRIQSLPVGVTELLLYFGNPDWVQGGSPESFFTTTGGWVAMGVVSPLAAAATLVVESFVDGNVITLEGGGPGLSLDARGVGTFEAADLTPGTLVRGLGPFYGTFTGADADALVPMAFASTLFVLPAVRYENLFDVVAPFGDAQVTIYGNDVQIAQVTVPAATPTTIAANVPNGQVARVESDIPVLVHHHATDSGNDYDSFVLVPPATDLLGGSTGTSRLVAAEDDTQVEVFYSDGTRESFVLGRTGVRVLGGAGTQGSGEAARVLASGPVMAVTTADGDGGETVSFLPRVELGHRYLLPLGAEYALVAAVVPATQCDILDQAGQVVTSQTSGTFGAQYPGRLHFAPVAVGHELRCSDPVWAMFEDPTTDTERNLWPMALHRPRVEMEPEAALFAVQTRYAATLGTVVTPTFTAPYAVEAWTAFLETATLPPGTWLRYQLSVDSGQTWLWHDGDAWVEAASPVQAAQANPWWQVHLELDSLPVAPNRLTVRVFLGSTDGSTSPVLDQLDLYYVQKTGVSAFAFDPIPSPQLAGRPFSVTLRAVDEAGRTIAGFSGSAYLQTLGGQTSPPVSPAFVNGAVTFPVSVEEVGEAVQLYAHSLGQSGRSDPFEVLAPTGARIELMDGDQQFALSGSTLEEPIRVRVRNAEGDPAAGITVSFAVTAGGGSLSPVSGGETPSDTMDVRTDAAGVAQVAWQLGSNPGANRSEARLAGAEGSPVTFLARADPRPGQPDPSESGGGCSCRTPGSSIPGSGVLLLLLGLGWLSRRRRLA